MKVRVTVDADARDRYVVSKYFGDTRARATRAQVRTFVVGAFGSQIREHGEALHGRQRSVVARLATGSVVERVELRQPAGRQLQLFVGAGEGG